MELRLPVTRIAGIVNEKRGINLEVAEDEVADKVEGEVRPLEAEPAR